MRDGFCDKPGAGAASARLSRVRDVATARKFYSFVFCLQFSYILSLPNVEFFILVFVLEIASYK